MFEGEHYLQKGPPNNALRAFFDVLRWYNKTYNRIRDPPDILGSIVFSCHSFYGGNQRKDDCDFNDINTISAVLDLILIRFTLYLIRPDLA